MSRKPQRVGELAKQILTEYPTAGSLTLAKRLHRDFPEHFETVETARNAIRYHRGTHGVGHRKSLVDLTHVKDLPQVLADKFALPEAAILDRSPYIMPKANDKGIVFGDFHIPYQYNKGIYEAIEYGIKKQANYIILNGDMVDMYQISRFTKDNRKPHIEYELEMFYEFLIELRDTFKNALIIWPRTFIQFFQHFLTKIFWIKIYLKITPIHETKCVVCYEAELISTLNRFIVRIHLFYTNHFSDKIYSFTLLRKTQLSIIALM